MHDSMTHSVSTLVFLLGLFQVQYTIDLWSTMGSVLWSAKREENLILPVYVLVFFLDESSSVEMRNNIIEFYAMPG